jgi:translation elongation factor EF-4
MNDHELTIKYQQQLKERLLIRSGADMPPNGVVAEIYEPFSDVEIVGPKDFS